MSQNLRRLLVGVLTVLALSAMAVAVWAYWTTDGIGQATATSGSLDAPVMAAPITSNGTVTLAWTASPAPGTGTISYAVERRVAGTEVWAPACSTSATVRITTTSCSEVPGDGTWEWRAVAYFHSWTAASEESDAVNVDDPDTTSPTGELTAPSSNSSVRGTVAVSSNSADADSGVASVRFQQSVHGVASWTTIGVPDPVAPYAVSWDTTTIADGLYDLRAITTDLVGNSHTSNVVANVRVDNTAPTATFALTSPTRAAVSGSTLFFDPAHAGSFRLVASVADAGSGAASAAFPTLSATGWVTHASETVTTPAGGPYTSTTFSWSSGVATPASYVVTVKDAVGNSAPVTVTFVPDTTASTSAVTAPVAGANVRGTTVSVTASASDGGAGVASVQFQRSPAGAATWTNVGAADTVSPYAVVWDTTALADGLYDLRVVTTDAVGNTATSAVTGDVRVDNTAPTVTMSLASGATGAFTNGSKIWFKSNAAGSYQLVAGVVDAGSGPGTATFPVLTATGWSTHSSEVVSSPAGGPFPSSAFAWASGASAPGTYTVTVADAAGNTATSALTFTADATAPTGSVTTPAASANVRGSAVSVTSSSADATSGVGSAQFQVSVAGAGAWSNLGAADTVAPYALTWDTTTLADALYDLRVVTTDNVGNAFTSATVVNVRIDNTAPTGAVTAPLSDAFLRGVTTMTTDSADGGSGIASVQFQRSAAGANTWANQGSADTAAPFSVAWTTTTSTPDGLYDLRAVTTDKAGNSFTSVSTNLRVDNTVPTGSVTAPAASANVRGAAVAVTSSSADTGSGVASVQFQWAPRAGSTWTALGVPLTASPYSTTWDTTAFVDGLYDLRVVTTDVAGNVTTSAAVTSVRVDNTAPTGAITGPSAGNVRATVSVISSSADAGSGVASALFQRSPSGADTWTNVATADTTSPYSASWVTTGVTDGLYDLRVTTTDKSGNTITSPLVTVRVDNTAPTVSTAVVNASSAFPAGTKIWFKSNTAGSFQLRSTVTDAGSGPGQSSFPVISTSGWTHAAEVVNTPAGGPFTSGTYSWASGATAPGTYTVTVADAAGNTATSAFTFGADPTAPTGAITAPAASANVRGSAVSVTSSSADAGAGVASAQFQVSTAGAGAWSNLGVADTATPYATTWDTTTFADGLYDLRVVTTDNVGNAFTSATIANVRVDNTDPTGAVTAPAVNAFVSGTAVAVSGSASDTGGGVASVQFQTSPRAAGTWTNLGAADTSSPYSTTWNTTSGYADGRYDLRLVVTDRSGNTSTSVEIPVEVQNAAPTVTAVQLANGTGTTGRVEAGDRIVVTYSQTLGATTICSTWSGNLTAQSLGAANDVTVTLVDGGAGNDTVTVTSNTCTLHLGTLNLGATGYVAGGSRTFAGAGGPTTPASSVVWDPSARTLTVTLGAASGLGTVGTVASSTATHTPDSAIRNAVGTAITGTFATGVVPQF